MSGSLSELVILECSCDRSTLDANGISSTCFMHRSKALVVNSVYSKLRAADDQSNAGSMDTYVLFSCSSYVSVSL